MHSVFSTREGGVGGIAINQSIGLTLLVVLLLVKPGGMFPGSFGSTLKIVGLFPHK